MTDEVPPPTAPVRSVLTTGLDAVADALRFFTRLPVPARWGGGDDSLRGAAAVSAFAGAVVGLAAAFALAASLAIGLPPLPAAVVTAAVAVAFSGALHLDGLADVADGLGGRTRERRLEIMRDSRLGAFGGAALTLALMLRVALVASLADRLGALDAGLALIAAAALSRPLAFMPTALLDPARPDGLGAAARPGGRVIAIGYAVGAAFALACLGFIAGAAALLIAAAAAASVVALARRNFGGHTGDVCGATAEIAELAALMAVLAAIAP